MMKIDIDKNGMIEKEEFIGTLSKFYEKFNIDPVQEFSLSLLAKINSLISMNGMDLIECLEEEDPLKLGYFFIIFFKIK